MAELLFTPGHFDRPTYAGWLQLAAPSLCDPGLPGAFAIANLRIAPRCASSARYAPMARFPVACHYTRLPRGVFGRGAACGAGSQSCCGQFPPCSRTRRGSHGDQLRSCGNRESRRNRTPRVRAQSCIRWAARDCFAVRFLPRGAIASAARRGSSLGRQQHRAPYRATTSLNAQTWRPESRAAQ